MGLNFVTRGIPKWRPERCLTAARPRHGRQYTKGISRDNIGLNIGLGKLRVALRLLKRATDMSAWDRYDWRSLHPASRGGHLNVILRDSLSIG